ncbi:MAG TPA: YceI family protein [Thermoanaerobaculia bacterium]|nr:YceI family protein [Thermoanaerobaculia bacterium]
MKVTRSVLLLTLFATPLFAQTPVPAPVAPAAATETWTVDKSHSMATFKVRHLMANVSGNFRDFDANINIDRANPANSSVDFSIEATSIDTGNTNRDEHLRSADFFDVTKFPAITFKSTKVTPKSKTEFDVTGDLTMHGVTKRVTLPVSFLGFGKDARGNEKAGFDIDTTVNRKDYGIVWNRTVDEGGLLLGDDVKVSISLEVGKKK